MTKVYRIEDRNNRGPYRPLPFDIPAGWYSVLQKIVERPIAATPTPPYDGLGWTPTNGVYGFTSLDQLFDWFGPEIVNDLQSIGYRVCEYEVPDSYIVRGGHQAVFIPTNTVQQIKL